MAKFYNTSETAISDFLKTRWYKCRYQKAKEAVLKVIKDYGVEPTCTDDTHGEIFVETNTFDMTITIFEFNVNETSVDIFYEGKTLFDFGKNKKNIIDFYDRLNKIIELKGLALHP